MMAQHIDKFQNMEWQIFGGFGRIQQQLAEVKC